jgi:hypothetical protein
VRVTYHGHEVMTYGGYLDTATGGTLVCEPGGSYDISPDVLPTDGRFTLEEAPSGEAGAADDTPADDDDLEDLQAAWSQEKL